MLYFRINTNYLAPEEREERFKVIQINSGQNEVALKYVVFDKNESSTFVQQITPEIFYDSIMCEDEFNTMPIEEQQF